MKKNKFTTIEEMNLWEKEWNELFENARKFIIKHNIKDSNGIDIEVKYYKFSDEEIHRRNQLEIEYKKLLRRMM